MTEQKPKKAKAAPPAHPTYKVMVSAAIGALKERNGSSRQAILKYIKANYKVGDNCDSHLRIALRRLGKSGTLLHPKGTGASGSFKLPKAVPVKKPKKVKAAKKPAKKAPKKAKAAKKPAKKAIKKTAKKAAKKPAKKAAGKKSPKKIVKAKKPAAKKTVKKPAAKKSKAKK